MLGGEGGGLLIKEGPTLPLYAKGNMSYVKGWGSYH